MKCITHNALSRKSGLVKLIQGDAGTASQHIVLLVYLLPENNISVNTK